VLYPELSETDGRTGIRVGNGLSEANAQRYFMVLLVRGASQGRWAMPARSFIRTSMALIFTCRTPVMFMTGPGGGRGACALGFADVRYLSHVVSAAGSFTQGRDSSDYGLPDSSRTGMKGTELLNFLSVPRGALQQITNSA